jgi:two-component system, cell cycle response regulator
MPARILIVEDNPDNLELMTYLLTAFGHRVIKAMDGEKGLRLLRQEKPDLVLCDLQLPKIDGFELVRHIREDPQLSKTPVVAVTAYAMRDDRDKVMEAGFNGYIAKPIMPEEFVSRAEEFLSEDLRSVALPSTNPPQQLQLTAARGSNRPTVLAVDSLHVNLNLIRSTLEPSGYSVLAFETAEEALEALWQEPPDVILCRAHLAGMSGLQFLEAVRKEPDSRAIPFILVFSSVPDPANAADALALGAANVLSYPLEPEVLIREVESCLKHRTAD